MLPASDRYENHRGWLLENLNYKEHGEYSGRKGELVKCEKIDFDL
jgi:hypothetical protein